MSPTTHIALLSVMAFFATYSIISAINGTWDAALVTGAILVMAVVVYAIWSRRDR
jgi:hypothetical protein